MAKFGVAARTLLHLGSELITSDEVAIYELIKNAFDAGSPRVSIRFHVPIRPSVINRWISLISDSPNIFLESIKEIKNTLPIEWSIKGTEGENIGLYDVLDMLDKSPSADNVVDVLRHINRIEIEDSGHGMSSSSLENAFLRIGTNFKGINSHRTDGSSVLGNKGIGRLSMMRLGQAATVETWNNEDEQVHKILFNWKDFDSAELLLDEINFTILSDEKKKSASGTKISIFHLYSNWNIERVEKDVVHGFLRRLNNPFEIDLKRFPVDLFFNDSKRLAIKPIKKELWELADRHLELEFLPNIADALSSEIIKSTISIPSIADSAVPQSRTVKELIEKLGCTLQDLKAIGPLKLKIRWFNRSKLAQRGLGSDLKKYKDELDRWNGGIAIYRDGFRIGLSGSSRDGDWLGIDSNAFRGQGFTLNRIQTIGALEISKDCNPNLIDRSNREGLIETELTQLLKNILFEFALKELKAHVQKEEKIQKKELERQLLDDGAGIVENRLTEAVKIVHDIQNIAPNAGKQITALHQNLQFITNHVKKFHDAINELKEKREDILELAGVGTVMHSVMHELSRTTSQTRMLLGKVAKNADPETSELLKKLEAEIKSINTRLTQLDPLSPNKRNRKGDFDLLALVTTIISGYHARFERHAIDFQITLDDDSPVGEKYIVTMVKGFASLAIENLLTNSIYWLKTGIFIPGDDSALITINIDTKAKVLEVYDNGPGISPTDVDRIFHPGFSLRKDGSGYGLYIAKEVSINHGSNIYLDKTPDLDGRLRRFIIELPKD
ncbi:hypothetical protein AYI92_10705 [Shewanella xiamenensis]|uniref:sensor histidine kinase n=1 Tax=Shewanella xiamenensis TaxID=332186 RepID=UPI001185CC81|nr:ATP-binding protein [Shewanella xiamenensis]TVL19687.1 hypothetical protein AYI90_10500 [Shewanella xiamenensis]TVL19810.1 hypothetical protein AYI91_10680 [Shewanella xiamenensis]TVL26103.1 hypothetical protein AYI92_10705 [Shewanella xiamenensis]TVL32748.1 hypothetical protein AYI93_10735 [Shewanella xiamenensis]TVP01748.1 hypothetical protein AYI89_09770 [Shewanella xiamenensis]